MAIYKTKREGDFTVIPNEIVNDRELSFKAKGVLLYLLSKPTTWKVRKKDIENNGKDGKDSIRSAIKELEKRGYIELGGQERNEDGTLGEMVYHVYDRLWRNVDKPAFSPRPEKPSTVKPSTDNPHIVNTDISNTELNKLPKGRDGTSDKRDFSVNRFIEGVNNNLDYKLPNDGQARRYAHNAIQLLTRTNAQGNTKEGREFLKEDVFENAQWFMTDYLNAKIERGFHPQKWGTLYDNLKLWIANEGRFPEDKLSKDANATQYAYRKYG